MTEKRYAASLVARKQEHRGVLMYDYADHTAVIVSAASEDEAIGKATKAAIREFPVDAGWHSHSTVVLEIP